MFGVLLVVGPPRWIRAHFEVASLCLHHFVTSLVYSRNASGSIFLPRLRSGPWEVRFLVECGRGRRLPRTRRAPPGPGRESSLYGLSSVDFLNKRFNYIDFRLDIFFRLSSRAPKALGATCELFHTLRGTSNPTSAGPLVSARCSGEVQCTVWDGSHVAPGAGKPRKTV